MRIENLLAMAAFFLCELIAPVKAAVEARQVLPGTVVPHHYDLSLVPDVQALTFNGTLFVAVAVKAATQDVTLNAVDLTFDRVTLDGKTNAATTYDTTLGRATLHFPAALTVGAHTLQIAYHGKIGRETLGFFAMDYKAAEGPKRILATNFEPASARKLLPCWDEPAKKASFTVSVVVPTGEMAVSNMPVAKTVPLSAALERVTFQQTPKMSTYLLFLGVGDFERIHETVDGVDVGVVVKRGDTAKSQYALEQAGKLLHFYDTYFGVHFPLPKLDLVAAPGEIEGGSMENWGAIFYSQQHLLFDPKNSTEADRQLVFEVVAHEMSHQWFGDLVTMQWWDNLWLNEGFARWMQTYAADVLHPEWETGLKAQSIFESGKDADALPSTHPVLQPILTADQAEEAFDEITYDKGAAVITMLNAYVGKDKFEEGVQRYMKAHAYGNTVDTDLWSIMQQVAGKPILKIEHDFTRQAGLPLVRVSQTPNGLALAEDRFYANPDDTRAETAQRWTIPLPVAAPGETPDTRLLQDNVTTAIASPAVINAGYTAYTRVLYPDAAFAALLPKMAALPAVDQIGLINDGLALGLADYAPTSRTLALITCVPPDADLVVWSRIISILTDIDQHYDGRPSQAGFRSFALKLLKPVAAHLGMAPKSGEDSNDAVVRNKLIEAQGHFGDATVVAWAKQMVSDGTGTAAERRAALEIAAEQATPAEFDALLTRARKTDDPLEKLHLYEDLGGVEDPVLAKQMIEIALGDEMPTGINVSVLIDAAENFPDLVWDEAVPHLADPKAAITKDLQWRLAAAVAALSAQPQRITQLDEYVAKNVPTEARKPFLGAAATIRQNIRIAATVLPELDAYVAAHP
jgi:aminopeptidase N